MEFSALLFIPSMRPFEAVEGKRESKVRLHVRRMFITDDASMLPPWLRFVDGVVDTEDLPLNVSREMLQTTPVLARIRKAVTNRVLTELKSKAKDAEDYAKFWDNFGAVLKEGIWEDFEHQKDIAPLLRFRSTTESGWTSLADYVSRMKPGQEAIYYLTGDHTEGLASSPQLEGFRARGVEVLLLSDPIDAFWPDRFDTFEEKKLKSVTQAAEDLAKLEAPALEGTAADVDALTKALKSALDDKVGDVRATDRLVDSAVVLAPDNSGPDLQMQRMLRRAGRSGPTKPPNLEINPRHHLIRALAARSDAGESVEEAARVLLDLARVQDGDPPADAAAFARRVTAFMAGSFPPPETTG
jgi:molecular chaperone HtpG